jgi:hypothetical protein
MKDLIQAIADVGRGHAQRIVKPGVWRVWRVGGSVMSEIFAEPSAS